MEEHLEKAFPGCKHTTDSAFNSIFSSVTSLILIVHMIIVVSMLRKFNTTSITYKNMIISCISIHLCIIILNHYRCHKQIITTITTTIIITTMTITIITTWTNWQVIELLHLRTQTLKLEVTQEDHFCTLFALNKSIIKTIAIMKRHLKTSSYWKTQLIASTWQEKYINLNLAWKINFIFLGMGLPSPLISLCSILNLWWNYWKKQSSTNNVKSFPRWYHKIR